MGKIESTPTKKITLEVKTPLVVFSKYKHKPNVNIGFVQYINVCLVQTYHIASVQFSRTVMSNSLQPHGLQHARLSCPSPTPGDCSNSCPSSWWGHPTISSSVIPFSSHHQSFPVPGSLQMSQFFASGDQNIGDSSSTSSPSNEYSGLISFRID